MSFDKRGVKRKDLWERMLGELKAWIAAEGNVIPPEHGDTASLSVWVRSLKSRLKLGKLSSAKAESLRAAGIDPAAMESAAASASDKKFLRRIELAKRYLNEQGDLCLTRRGWTLVQSKALSQDELKELAEWMHKIRERRNPDADDPQITAIRAELPMFVWDSKSKEYEAKAKENKSSRNRRINEKRRGRQGKGRGSG
ncbi:MAG: helicase associated domain-containing protein [Nitrospirae bacterium]|nr:helicase associated domain-containing protein [Nitrospirota bacterium]